MRGPFPIDAQQTLSRELIEAFGATGTFRLDLTVHPFEVTFGLGDIRLTTRYKEDDIKSLFTAMHECGHGALRARRRARRSSARRSARVLVGAARVAEPAVGERRRPLAAVLALVLPARAGGVPGPARRRDRSSSFHRAVNRVQPLVHPRRRGRDDLRPAHHPPLRARAGAHRRPARRRRTCPTRGTRASRSSRDRGAERHARRAPGRRTGRAAPSATSRPTSSATCSPSRSGRRRARRSRTSTSRSSRASSAQLHEWLRENLYALGRKFTPAGDARARRRRPDRPGAVPRATCATSSERSHGVA